MREVILPALDTTGARRVVEVGGEDGGFTTHLAERAAANGGHVAIVDPAPSPELERMVAGRPELALVREASPAALHTIAEQDGVADAYVLDGDHNYETVSGELAAVFDAAGTGYPLAVLHDIGWPWARRDLYYAPDALPPATVHPHTYE